VVFVPAFWEFVVPVFGVAVFICLLFLDQETGLDSAPSPSSLSNLTELLLCLVSHLPACYVLNRGYLGVKGVINVALQVFGLYSLFCEESMEI
jgi:hypothetical protein